MRQVTVSCAACGAEFEKQPAEVKRSKTGRFFCNKECQQRGGSKPRRGEEIPCEVCGERFYRGPNETKTFCSRDCANEARKSRDALIFQCEICGKERRVPPSVAKLNANRFCSRECQTVGRIKRPLDRHHNGFPARLDHYGYVLIYEPDHPNAIAKGWIYEHRYVMSSHLGRPLTTDEEVDHINRDKTDNRLENLQILSAHEHAAKTSADRRQDRDMADFLRSNPDLLAAFEASRLG